MSVIEELTSGPEFVHNAPDFLDTIPGAVVVLAGQHVLDTAQRLADEIAALPWALTVVCSDEEALFPVDLLPRDDRHQVWNQYHDRGMDRVIPIGHPPGTLETLAQIEQTHPARRGDVFFGGQNTHARRNELLDVMKDMACDPRRYGNLTWAATTGFREGLSQDRYLAAMRDTRIAPCPSGPHSLDSFRLYEALVAGALPIVETCTPHGPEPWFWETMFGDHPFPEVHHWHELKVVAELFADGPTWQAKRDEVRAWWYQWRAQLSLDFRATIERLKG